MNHSFTSYTTLSHLFRKRPPNASQSSMGIHTTILDQKTFEVEAGTDNEVTADDINRKCHCSTTNNDMVLNNWEMFTFTHCKDREAVKTSAAQTIHQVETEMALPSKISGRPNILMRWIETRGYKELPDDYECKECLERKVKIDPFEKEIYFERGPTYEESRDGIYAPKPVMRQSFRRNPFKEIQLCPHLLNKIMGVPKEQMRIKREDNLIDFIRTQAELNHAPEEPRAGMRRVDSVFFEAIFKSIDRPKSPQIEERKKASEVRKDTMDSSFSDE